MADVLTPAQRSFCMSRIKSQNTTPERIVRRLVHHMGYRYRLHVATLPGKPDLVLPRHRKIIFVHGCYWHLHACKVGRVTPKTNAKFWINKREGNRDRDRRTLCHLRYLGWRVLVVWECQTKELAALQKRIKSFLKK